MQPSALSFALGTACWGFMKFFLCLLGVLLAHPAQSQVSPSVSKPDEKPAVGLRIQSDLLAVHATGKAPAGANRVEYRVNEPEVARPAHEWSIIPVNAQGEFAFDWPLKASRWASIEVRALKDEALIAERTTRPPSRKFEHLTAEAIAASPEAERSVWQAYFETSESRFNREFDLLASECRQLNLPRARPASGGSDFEFDRAAGDAWFAGTDAGKLTDAILSYQTPSGGWSKSVNYSSGPRQPGTHWTSQNGEDGWHYCGTLDNRSTTDQILLLASVHAATQRTDARDGALRGIEWLLAAQYPNGGWPQNYPLESGYHEAITLNDNAMLHAMEILLLVADGDAPFGFTASPLRDRARAAFRKGLACLAAAQVRLDGKPTVWCAQHDPITLAPAAARKKEPPALSGGESASLLQFLMRKAPVEPTTTAMIEPALAWLDAHRVTGIRKVVNAAGKTDYVADPESKEVYWARFYDVQTAKPIFAGSQDGVIYATFSEMAAKNRVGYDYFTTKPGEILEREVPRWRKRLP